MHANQSQQPLHRFSFINYLQQIYKMSKGTKLPRSPAEQEDLLKRLKEQIIKLNTENSNDYETAERVSILSQRVRLISSIKQGNDGRVSNIQKILKHYSTNVFKPGQKYDFDQIKYINEHLILERFLSFVKDFGLNQITVKGEVKPIVDPKEIALLFKRCSSNSRNLDLAEFLMLLERLFLLLFNENQNYTKKQRQLKLERRQKREEAKKREQLKRQKLIAKFGPQAVSKQGSNGRALKAISPLAKQKSKDKERTKNKPNAINQKPEQDLGPMPSANINIQTQVLYQISDEQKIESYMLRMAIDDRKQIEKKLHSFTKADYRYYQTEELERYKEPKKVDQSRLEESDPKKELVSMHSEWKKQKRQVEQSNADRFNDVRDQLSERQLVKSKHLLSRSLSQEDSDVKKIGNKQKLLKRQSKLIDALTSRNQATSKEQSGNTVFYSLQMLHRSTPNQLPINKILPNQFITPDPTDRIYMQQFDLTHHNRNRRISHSNAQMIEQTKRQAFQLQNQQSKHLSRFINHVPANHDYLKKFLVRKW